jgi:hypothetical protein
MVPSVRRTHIYLQLIKSLQLVHKNLHNNASEISHGLSPCAGYQLNFSVLFFIEEQFGRFLFCATCFILRESLLADSVNNIMVKRHQIKMSEKPLLYRSKRELRTGLICHSGQTIYLDDLKLFRRSPGCEEDV